MTTTTDLLRGRLPYDAHRVEARWRRRWAEARCHEAGDGRGRPAFFNFDGGPFPNGALHAGHLRTFALGDAMARYRRLTGHDVLYCFEFDAFGLPNELAAEEAGVSPEQLTRAHIELMREQMGRLGFSYDWRHVHATCDPRYYRWTQWLFLELLEQGLVFRAEAPLNFCPSCATTLAQMQVEDGRCWRCETLVERRRLPQWFVRLSAYSEVLWETLDDLDGWSAEVRGRLRSVIGRSEGLDASFAVVAGPGAGGSVTAFAPDRAALEGAGCLVAAPSSAALEALLGAGRALELQQGDVARPWRRRGRDGAGADDWVDVGVRVRHPLTGRELPLLVSESADPWFAGGVVVAAGDGAAGADGAGAGAAADGAASASGAVRPAVHYRVRDWLVSRQRRWGTPIPIVHCGACGAVPVARGDLPVPVAAALGGGAATACPRCGEPAARDPDTLDCYFDVVWCYLACSSRLDGDFRFAREDFEPWQPVDWFHNGVDSLYYAHLYRFLGRALHERGLLADPEPIRTYHGHGTVLQGGRKMSKHLGNAVALGDLLDEHGGDVLRLHVLWAASPLRAVEWREGDLDAARRLAAAAWTLVAPRGEQVARALAEPPSGGDGGKLVKAALQAARRVARLIERYRMSACVQELHLLRGRLAGWADGHGLAAGGEWPREQAAAARQFARAVRIFVVLLAPFAPHLAEELWESTGGEGLVAEASWPA